jgi:choline dehydrogenase
MILAAAEQGIPTNPDFNGARQDGAGYFQYTIRNGRRASPASAYLHPVRSRRNLRVVTGAHVQRVTFDGTRASGVVYARGGRQRTVQAHREVILCGGTFNSPQLLELSGIGAAERLRALGIPVVRDCAAVGEQYQDHFGIRMAYRCREPVTLNDQVGHPLRRARDGRALPVDAPRPDGGPGLPAGCFVRSHPDLPSPDLELVLSLWTMVQGERNKARVVDPYSAFGMVLEDLKPAGRGHVHVRSADPAVAPRIVCNLFATPRDERAMVAAVGLARRIFASPALARYSGAELLPGADVRTDDDIVGFVRANGFGLYHPVGTCAMGASDAAVLDPQLRVRGVHGLRVIDASVMPVITSGNIQATVGMIGEKGAAAILDAAS